MYSIPATGQPNEIVISSDDGYLYLVSNADSSIYVLNRNSTTGALTQVQRMVNDGIGNLTIINNTLAIAQNKPYLYATGGNGVNVFERDVNTGLLTFKQNESNSVVTRGVTISPDDNFVYVGNFPDTSISIYQDTTIQVMVSIENLEDKTSIEAIVAYPNPATDYINIQVADALENKQLRIRLYNLNGQLIKESELTVQNGLVQLNLSDLPRGNYMLNLGKESISLRKE